MDPHGLLQRIVLLFVCRRSYLTGNTRIGLHLLLGELYFLYVDDVQTSQETQLWTSTASCGDCFVFCV
jgi:hypothetical protein